MRYFLFLGGDAASDRGFFEIIIEASTKRLASGRVKMHLRRLGRPDLLEKELSCIEIDTNALGVLYSTVGRRGDL